MKKFIHQFILFSYFILIPIFGYSQDVWYPDSVTQKFRKNCEHWTCQNSIEQVQNISTYYVGNEHSVRIVTYSSPIAIFQVIYLEDQIIDFSGLETNGFAAAYQHDYKGIVVNTYFENGVQAFQEVIFHKKMDEIYPNQKIYFGDNYVYEQIDDDMHDPYHYSSGSIVTYKNLGIGIHILDDHVENGWLGRFRNPDYVPGLHVKMFTLNWKEIDSRTFNFGSPSGIVQTTEVINGLCFTKYQMKEMAVYTFPHSWKGQRYPTVQFVIPLF